MKKINVIILILLLTLPVILRGFTFQTESKETTVTLQQLKQYTLTEFKTHREKHEKIIDDTWKGVNLNELLKTLPTYDKVRITSADNYQVRLTKEEIEKNNPILALYRNNVELKENEIRLVISNMRDMYWIADISSIVVEKAYTFPTPSKVFIVESVLATERLQINPKPFKDVQGYRLSVLFAPILPIVKEPVRICTMDGIEQQLDYEQYLQEGVFVKNADNYELRSPSMPGGMWMKKMAYMQVGSNGFLIVSSYTDLTFMELAKKLGWELPSKSIHLMGNKGESTFQCSELKVADLLNTQYRYFTWE